MRRFITILAATLLLCVCGITAQQTATTSVPNLIRYSGTLTAVQGASSANPTPVGITFAIYKQQDGGAAVWQETQNVTPDASGQYSVLLGSTTSTGLSDDLFSQKEDRWLGVRIEGQEEQARVMLVSVPYAFKAHEADTLGGLPASAFVQAAPASGSGSSAAGTAVNGLRNGANGGAISKGPSNQHLPPGPCNPVSGFLTYWDSTGALCKSSLQQIANGNIGIGVTNPSEPLDVQGVISTYTWYDISERRVLSVGSPASAASTNLFLGFLSGGLENPTTDVGTYNTFAGRESAYNNTSGSYDAFYGYRAGYHNTTGGSNTIVGYQAGFQNDIGNNNTYLGRSSAFNGSGSGNVCVGYTACYNNTASNNTFVGTDSGRGNIGGTGNTYLGYDAGLTNASGANNTFVGQNAGKANTVDGNSFFGYSAGGANTTGAANTFLGVSAGAANTTGGGNTYVGFKAGLTSAPGTGTCCNTFVGNGAGQGIPGPMQGAANSCYGHRACEALTTGGKNAAFGFTSGLVNQTGSFNSFYGDQSGQSLMTGDYNTMLGISTGGSFASGNWNTFVGAFAGNSPTSGNSNVYISNVGATENNTIRVGTLGTGNGQQNMAFFEPILGNPNTGLTTVVTIDPTPGSTSGKLGYTTVGGGNVSGPGNCTANFLTKWVGGNNVDCSHVWENPASPYFVGIGTTTPGDQLEVNGDIGAAWDTSSFQLRLPSGLATILSAYGDRDTYLGFSATPLNCGNTTGNCEQNTFAGANAGTSNTDGSYNSFFGSASGNAVTTGSSNTFLGQGTGVHTTTAGNNTFVGTGAGFSNFTGSNNAYLGDNTGGSNEQGNSNIFVGSYAGRRSATAGGSSNIYLAHPGCTTVGGCPESNTIRIGFQYSTLFSDCGNLPNPCGQKFVFMEPVLLNPNPANSGNVVIDVSTGQLGFIGSSRRFKEQIADMGDKSSKLFQLRPVTFLYKAEYDHGTRVPQYGLIAEEVAKIYPDLVAYDKDGQPLTVKYQLLAPMLLNELQKEHQVVMAQQEDLQTQLQQIKAQRQEIDGLKRQLQLQNASLQERLQKLESYVATQMKVASDNPPQATLTANGGGQ